MSEWQTPYFTWLYVLALGTIQCFKCGVRVFIDDLMISVYSGNVYVYNFYFFHIVLV